MELRPGSDTGPYSFSHSSFLSPLSLLCFSSSPDCPPSSSLPFSLPGQLPDCMGLTGPSRPAGSRHLSTFQRMNSHTKTQRLSINLEGKTVPLHDSAELPATLIFFFSLQAERGWCWCGGMIRLFDLCLFKCKCALPCYALARYHLPPTGKNKRRAWQNKEGRQSAALLAVMHRNWAVGSMVNLR